MWILPKQLHTSDFVPDTAALSLDCTELSEICARSLFVRSKPSAARIWRQRWKRDSWTQHLSGRILNPSHGQSFVTAWTSSLGAIPASPSAQPENASAQTTLGTSGLLSQTEFGFCDPSSASLRMSKDTSPSDSEKSLESWNQSVTKRRGEYSARLKSAHRTSGNGSSSWPTIRASEYKDTGPIGSKSHDHMLGKGYLCAVVTQDAANWLTPQSGDVTGSTQEAVVMWANGKRPKTSDQRLRTQVAAEQLKYGPPAPANPSTDGSRQGLWRTPSSSDGEGGVMEMREGCAGKYKLRDHAANGNKSAKLNPRWVETLQGVCMGWTSPSCPASVIKNWPKFVSGWCALTIEQTNCDSSATESCLPPPSELFAF